MLNPGDCSAWVSVAVQTLCYTVLSIRSGGGWLVLWLDHWWKGLKRMIRLTVLYNLMPHVDEKEFLEWRLSEHQQENMSVGSVLRSDFARIEETYPAGAEPPYRFMTTADWPDMESFKASFYDPEYQKRLQENLKLLHDPLFLISEILVEETNA